VSQKGRGIDIYVPAELRARLGILPPRSVSRICQDALRAAVEKAEADQGAAVSDALEED
jgi:hypothetical protein